MRGAAGNAAQRALRAESVVSVCRIHSYNDLGEISEASDPEVACWSGLRRAEGRGRNYRRASLPSRPASASPSAPPTVGVLLQVLSLVFCKP